MNQDGYPKPKIENGFDKIWSVTVRLKFLIQLDLDKWIDW